MRPTHDELVRTLVKSPITIQQQLNPAKVDLIHAVLGINGEAGELLDAVKKHVIYNKPLDVENVKEEIGDLLFYLRQLCQRIGYTFEQAEQQNIDKLLVRYEGMQYTDQAAQDRKDKQNDNDHPDSREN